MSSPAPPPETSPLPTSGSYPGGYGEPLGPGGRRRSGGIGRFRGRRLAWAAYGLDLVAVLAFVLIGRANHGESDGFAGIGKTLWPFTVGLLVGWALVAVGRRQLVRVVSGIVVLISTVALGMLLRAASDQGVDVSFVVVATVFLGIFLLGWRLVARWLARRVDPGGR